MQAENISNLKIISGAQTGVDRAALDAALEYGVAAGGWCPQGRIAEDGIIPPHYPVRELANGGYQERTQKNITDSDGTLIIYYGYPSGGTEQTLAFCITQHKPYVLIDAEEITVERAIPKLMAFIRQASIHTLNVAGPRASGEPRAYDYTKSLILGILQAKA